MTDGVIEPGSKRRKGNGVSHKEYERLKNRAYGGEAVAKDIVENDQVPVYDPWVDVVEQQDPQFSYLEKPKPIRAPKTLKQAPISLVAGAKTIPAVLKPKAGTSYNPDFQDWSQLLTEEGGKEVEAEKKRRADAAVEEEIQKRIAAAQNGNDDYQTEDESAWEGFESEYEGAEWLTKRRPERKTPAERNKVKRRKLLLREAKAEAKMKQRAEQAKHIQAIAKEVVNKEHARAIAPIPEDESSNEFDDRIRRRKLGKATYAFYRPSYIDLTDRHPRLPEAPLELVCHSTSLGCLVTRHTDRLRYYPTSCKTPSVS